jgi:PncC family amidohydrolase
MKEKSIQNTCAKVLIDKGLRIAVAESCTGGLLSCKLTDIPGSSAYFDRGFITYSNLSKIEMLGVSKETIDEHGAVSSETALEMAKGALKNSSADIALAITGIAGPTGGTVKKPVGTVFIALAAKTKVNCQKYNFSGNRLEIREQASIAALKMLLDAC